MPLNYGQYFISDKIKNKISTWWSPKQGTLPQSIFSKITYRKNRHVMLGFENQGFIQVVSAPPARKICIDNRFGWYYRIFRNFHFLHPIQSCYGEQCVHAYISVQFGKTCGLFLQDGSEFFVIPVGNLKTMLPGELFVQISNRSTIYCGICES